MTGNGYIKVTLWVLMNMLITSLALGWSIALAWEYQTRRRNSYPAWAPKVMTVLPLFPGL